MAQTFRYYGKKGYTKYDTLNNIIEPATHDFEINNIGLNKHNDL